ncbi:MAG TPA: sugar ABC transporter permease [Candidatus Hungatella pullicola]|nr:sugar ABC transporter permease [Candidatus Hungatella pullicola]
MKRKTTPYLMLMPYFLAFLAFNIFPIVFSFAISFTDWNGVSAEKTFAGFSNYVRALTQDSFFWLSLKNTIIMTIMIIPGQIFLGLLMACLLKEFFFKWRGTFQLINFLPYITTSVALAIIFQLMFDWKNGIINGILNVFGIESVYWLGKAWPTRIVVALMEIWKNYGYAMIMFMAGLSTIPEDLYEAAKIDGANWRQRFIRITIPMLKPIFAFTVTTGVIGVLNLFDGPQLLFSSVNQPLGGPDRSVFTIMIRFYEASFLNFEYGYGASIAYLFFVFVTAVSILLVRAFQEKD